MPISICIVDGQWTGFGAPELTGTAHIKNAQADVPGVIETVQVNSAVAEYRCEVADLAECRRKFHQGPELHRIGFDPPQLSSAPCPMTFTVHADELSPERLNQLFNPKLRSRPWYNFFMPHPEETGETRCRLLEATADSASIAGKWRTSSPPM